MNREDVEFIINQNIKNNVTRDVSPQDIRDSFAPVLDWIAFINSGGDVIGQALPTNSPSDIVGYDATKYQHFDAFTAGTYTNWKNSSAAALVVSTADLDAGKVVFVGVGEAFEKHIIPIDLIDYIKKTDIVSSLDSTATDKAAAAASVKNLRGELKASTEFGTMTDVTGATTAIKLDSHLGTASSATGYLTSDFISVVPGETITVDMRCLGSLTAASPTTFATGLAGYGANNEASFLSAIGANGFPIGELFDKDINAYITGVPVSNAGIGVDFSNVSVIIPEGCYYVRGCSGNQSGGGIPLKIVKETYDSSSETVKDKVLALESASENTIQTSDIINSLSSDATDKPLAAAAAVDIVAKITTATKYGTLTDVTGTTTQNKLDSHLGTAGANAGYNTTGFLPVVPGETIVVTLRCLGSLTAAAPTTFVTGLAGYGAANEASFLSTIGSNGFPVGELWDKDIYSYITGNPITNAGIGVDYTDVEVVIPDGCYYVRACSGNGAPVFAVKQTVYDSSSETVKDKVLALESAAAGNLHVSDIVNSLESDATDKPAAAAAVKNLRDEMKSSTEFGTMTDVTGATTVDKLDSHSGANIDPGNAGYKMSGFIPVVPGETVTITMTCIGSLTATSPTTFVTGLAGYGAANEASFLSTLGSNGFPIGELFDRDIVAWSTGTTISNGGASADYSNIPVVIPEGCYYIRGTSAKQQAGGLTLKIMKEVYDSSSVSVKDKITELENSTSTSDEMYRSKIASQIKAYQYAVSPSSAPDDAIERFGALWYSDVHHGFDGADENHAEMNDFAGRALIAPQLDAILCTGDLCEGTATTPKATAMSQLAEWVTRHLASPVPAMAIMGNHDDNINWNGDVSGANIYVNRITKSEQYTTLIKPLSDKWAGIHTYTDKCYSYMDFASKKIRIIGLDCYELPSTGDGVGGYKYKTGTGQYYSQAQLDWLYTTLNSTPADYHVIVLNHTCPVDGLAMSFYMQGIDFIPSVIDAWKNGTSFTHTYNNASFPELNTSKVFDFTTKGAGIFCCYLAGHIHTYEFATNATFPDQHALVVPCMKPDPSIANKTAATRLKSGLNRDTSTIELRNAFAYFSVDTRNKQITLVQYGAYLDEKGLSVSNVKFINY